MAINTLATATLFQTNLDLLATQTAKTGWMNINDSLVQYHGGAEVKIPKMTVNGLGDYDRDDGYVQGGVTLTYETRSLTQDRGRKFQLDAMDVDENNFVTTAARVMGEFQRTKVVPEIDAYRISKLATHAITNNTAGSTGQVEYGYTPAAATIIAKMEDAIKYLRDDCDYEGVIMFHINGDVDNVLKIAALDKIRNTTFSQGGIKLEVPSIDECPLIVTSKKRMYTAITTYDGTTEGQKVGGYAKASGGLDINFIAVARDVPIAVTKQDKMKIFTPDQNQDADAWKMNYRRFHDLWALDNQLGKIFVNIKDAQPQGASGASGASGQS